ncbi:MAG: hypothetical protein Q6370_020345 [Candidatus Sigynarchaeota archaeon]
MGNDPFSHLKVSSCPVSHRQQIKNDARTELWPSICEILNEIDRAGDIRLFEDLIAPYFQKRVICGGITIMQSSFDFCIENTFRFLVAGPGELI